MQKYSDQWCESVAVDLVDSLTRHDANECDGILAMAFAVGIETGEAAADVLRSLADQLDADDQKRAGALN